MVLDNCLNNLSPLGYQIAEHCHNGKSLLHHQNLQLDHRFKITKLNLCKVTQINNNFSQFYCRDQLAIFIFSTLPFSSQKSISVRRVSKIIVTRKTNRNKNKNS